MDLTTTLPRRVVVTGAMSGIGRAVAEGVLAAGGRVLSLDLDITEWSHPRMVARRVDVTTESDVDAAFADASETLLGPPDAVIHCAGIYRWAPLGNTTVAEWDRVLRVNATGAFIIAKAAAAAMPRGVIVLLSSVAYGRGDEGEPGAAYSASKGAIVSLTQQLAVELGARDIRVNAVAPGMIDTPMLTLNNDPAAVTALTHRLPARRLGTAQDVAAACLFLASGSAEYITGATLPVDGGYLVA